MSYYRVKYNIDSFKSPHTRYYHARNAETALSMFEETRTHELEGYSTSVIDVSPVRESNDSVISCESNECCNNDCQ